MKKIIAFPQVVLIITGLSSAGMSMTAPKTLWQTYSCDDLGVQLTVPASWVAATSDQAIAFRTTGALDSVAGVALMRSDEKATNPKEFSDASLGTEGLDHWSQSHVTIAGLEALRVIGYSKGNSALKLVRYYIATPSGPYLLQFMAPANNWRQYKQYMKTIVDSIHIGAIERPSDDSESEPSDETSAL